MCNLSYKQLGAAATTWTGIMQALFTFDPFRLLYLLLKLSQWKLYHFSVCNDNAFSAGLTTEVSTLR